MRILAWLLMAAMLWPSALVLAEDYSGSDFILRDPFLTLVGGYSSSSSFAVFSQTGARIESGYSAGGAFVGRAGTESYAHFTSPVITATAGDTEVDLSWTASTTYFGGVVSSYSVGQATASGGPYTYTSVGVSTSTTVTGLTNDTIYYFVIKVNDANLNQNTYSSEVSSVPVAAGGGGAGGSGGGGGGGSPGPVDGGTEAGDNLVTFAGTAFPRGRITLLKDGEFALDTEAASNGTFEMALTGLSTGTYNFVIYGEDTAGHRSAVRTFRVAIASENITNISGIYLSPTLSLTKSQVKRGDSISIFGQTAPASLVSIFLDGQTVDLIETSADEAGKYSYSLPTQALRLGNYTVMSRSSGLAGQSDFGTPQTFTVADENVPVIDETYLKGDLNEDGQVNLVDFAIAGFWYKRELSPAFSIKEQNHLNGDGRLDLVDFAIMAYYWSG
ncbi:MAG: hypothetical protein WAZ14_04655 [Patescibacteria group bacterium]